jgi:hypothetical protein
MTNGNSNNGGNVERIWLEHNKNNGLCVHAFVQWTKIEGPWSNGDAQAKRNSTISQWSIEMTGINGNSV